MKKNNPGFHPWNVSTRISHGATFRTLQLFVRPRRHPRSSHCRRASELNMLLGQIITTSAEVIPNGGLVRESPSKSPFFRFRNYTNLPRCYLGLTVFFQGKLEGFFNEKNNLGTPDSGFKDQGIPPKWFRNNLGLGIIEYFLAGGNSNIFGIFIPRIGDDISNLTHIFFKWVETTN